MAGTRAIPPRHRNSGAWSGEAQAHGLRLSPDAEVTSVVWPWLWGGTPGTPSGTCWATGGLGHRSALEPVGPKSCSSWPSAEAVGPVSVGHVGWGPGAPSVCASSLSSVLTEAGGWCLQPPSLLEAGRPLDGAAGVSRRSGKVDQSLSRAALPSTLHAACPGAQLLGWKDRRPESIALPWTVGLPAETY